MATEATFDNQLQALATATANFANGKDAQIKNTIITALGGGSSSGKRIPTLTVTDNGDYSGTITYDGDGTLTAYCGYFGSGNKKLWAQNITGNTLYIDDTLNDITGIILASEGEKYSPAWATFVITGYEHGPV